MEAKLGQDSKALLAKLDNPSPISMDVKPVQFMKAIEPMLVTLLGMSIDVKLMQHLKALLPMLVTVFGIVIEVIVSNSGRSHTSSLVKASFSILVTVYVIPSYSNVSGITISP